VTGVQTCALPICRSEEKLSAAKRENSVITFEKDYEQHYAGYDSNSDESNIMFEFIHDENMAKSVELSKCIQKNLCSAANRPDKGVKQDNFHVLRRTSMPACLVELGFISTPDEEQYLNTAEAIDKMAYGIYLGFLQYKNQNTNEDVAYNPDVQPKVSYAMEPAASRAYDDMQNGQRQEEAPRAENRRSHNNEPTRVERQQPVKVERPQPAKVDKPQSAKVEKQQPAKAEKQQSAKADKPQPAKADKQQSTKTVNTQTDKKRSADVEKGKDNKKPSQKNDTPVYKIQIATGPKPLKNGDPAFKGLKDVSCVKEGNSYKFFIGAFDTFSAANAKKKEITDKFPDAFIIAYRNGQRIDVNEARKANKK